MKCPFTPLCFRKSFYPRHDHRGRDAGPIIWLALLLLPASRNLAMAYEGAEENVRMELKINRIVADFCHRLGIFQQVTVSVVSDNSRLASATCSSARAQEYEISLDAGFLRTLDDGELDAAVAHEMGHIWIFTHFPYLQTESLANQQALKLVPRGELQKVYEKMWKWRGEAHGDLSDLLGPSTETGIGHDGNRYPHGNR